MCCIQVLIVNTSCVFQVLLRNKEFWFLSVLVIKRYDARLSYSKGMYRKTCTSGGGTPQHDAMTVPMRNASY